jgi:predicted enzyme related to lactoylglutathione lyase
MAAPTSTHQPVLRDAPAFASFSVDDLQQAKKFYGQTLGLNVSEEQDMGLNLRMAGGTQVFIYPKPNHEPATFTVLNFPVGDLEETMDGLSKRGVRFETYDQPDLKTDEKGVAKGPGPGPKIAWFKDPAGNVLSVLEER